NVSIILIKKITCTHNYRKMVAKNLLLGIATIIILAVGSISIMGTTQFVRGQPSPNPTPTTGTLNVTIVCISQSGPCPPVNDFKISVTGDKPSPKSFKGNATGTQVTLGAGQYKVSETAPDGRFQSNVQGDCVGSGNFEANGTIAAGETQKCTIENDSFPP